MVVVRLFSNAEAALVQSTFDRHAKSANTREESRCADKKESGNFRLSPCAIKARD